MSDFDAKINKSLVSAVRKWANAVEEYVASDVCSIIYSYLYVSICRNLSYYNYPHSPLTAVEDVRQCFGASERSQHLIIQFKYSTGVVLIYSDTREIIDTITYE